MSVINGILDRVLMGCAVLSGAILAAIAAGIALNVLLRNGFGLPIYGLLDLVQYGLLVVTFLGAPWVLWQQAHVAVDLVTGALPVSVARPLARITAGIGLAASVVAMRYGIEAAAVSFGRGSMIRAAFAVPEWLVLSVMPLGFGLLALEFLRQALRGPVRVTGLQGL